MSNDNCRRMSLRMCNAVSWLASPIIVHGGGKEISWVGKVGKEAKFKRISVTDAETMEIGRNGFGHV